VMVLVSSATVPDVLIDHLENWLPAHHGPAFFFGVNNPGFLQLDISDDLSQ